MADDRGGGSRIVDPRGLRHGASDSKSRENRLTPSSIPPPGKAYGDGGP